MSKTRMITLSAIVALIGAVNASAASAHRWGGWQAHHPRRVQVNHRIQNQMHRITYQRREGDLTRAQAQDLRGNVRDIRAQERLYASHQNGHITRQQQRALNQRLNRNSRMIGR